MKWQNLHVFRLTICLCLASLLTAPHAFAANETMRLSIAFSPGGALDSAARVLAGEAEKELGVSIIVQNTPSAGGMTAVARLAEAKADGTQLAACVTNALIFIP